MPWSLHILQARSRRTVHRRLPSRHSLEFDITTNKASKRKSRIEFRDDLVMTAYKGAFVDRAGAFLQAKVDDEAKLLKQMHTGRPFSGPSHLMDLSRPSNDVALPGVFFHANGDVEVGWRELFAAVLAEEKYNYRIGHIPVYIQVSLGLSRKAVINDQTQIIEETTIRVLSKKMKRASIGEKGVIRGVDIYEFNMSKAKQAKALRARVFHMVVLGL